MAHRAICGVDGRAKPHRSFEDMSAAMGLGKGAVTDHEKNKMARSTAPTDPHQKRLLEEATISEMKAAEEKKAASKAKAADKKNNTSMLLPSVLFSILNSLRWV